MSETKSWWRRLSELVIPPVPDFHGMLAEQAENLENAARALQAYLQQGDPELAEPVRAWVRTGHALRDRNLAQLHRTFITPIDREDIYTLTMTFDHILDYIKNTVREVGVLQLQPDDWMQKMAQELTIGAGMLRTGLALLRSGKAGEVPDAVNTRHQERHVEKLYRKALAEMFEGPEYQELSAESASPSVREALEFVVTRIKKREVYRHLSNAADRLAHAGEALRDISIKYE
ncbi:MAG: DUF47 domain-containing protein [Gammaproteobacteria bacterium]